MFCCSRLHQPWVGYRPGPDAAAHKNTLAAFAFLGNQSESNLRVPDARRLHYVRLFKINHISVYVNELRVRDSCPRLHYVSMATCRGDD